MKYTLFAIAICSSLFFSCNPRYYMPNTQNVPLLTQKGETNLTASGANGQYELHAAHAVSNSISIMANGGLFKPEEMDNGDRGSGNFVELGAGYYKPFENKLVLETFGVLGFGSMENRFPSTVAANPGTKGDISANMFRYGVQANFGYKTKYFEAAVSARFFNLLYNNIKGDLIYNGENQVVYLKDNKSNFLFEPALTLRGGLEKVKLQLQVGGSLNLTNDDFFQENSFITFGINLNIR
jgi:hypothetical protein